MKRHAVVSAELVTFLAGVNSAPAGAAVRRSERGRSAPRPFRDRFLLRNGDLRRDQINVTNHGLAAENVADFVDDEPGDS